MDKFVVTSLRQGAGKTSIIIGLAKALNRKIGYIKPLGERLLYRKKRLWDYDAALITSIFDMEENPEEMSIGFHHSKIQFMLDENSTREKLLELRDTVGKDKGIFFAECGKDITYGASIHLDALTLTRQLDAQLIVIATGDDDAILDDVIFLKKQVNTGDVPCKGIIINKVANVADFSDSRLPLIKRHGIDILGIIPYCAELSCFSVGYLADRLFAKIITGEGNLKQSVKEVFIGSMSTDAAFSNPLFKEENKVVITSGDRSDMIDAALESKAVAVILTNNILPSSDLISKAASLATPLLLVSADTCEILKQIEGMEALLTTNDTEKIATLEQLVRTHVDLQPFSQIRR
ncbi:MAG: DRTGG domain-containing protein [Syntrophales bacterium]